VSRTTPVQELAARAASYAIPGERVDGNDVLAIHATVAAAVLRARAGEGPTLIEALTYRHRGHSRSDPATYRPPGELEAWLQNDPIPRLEARLEADGVDREAIERTRAAAERAVDDALERALAAPEPELALLHEDVYA
jgi:acetoin:2,6-dichlorophenolindophenol oxidoreductase subunit alpha